MINKGIRHNINDSENYILCNCTNFKTGNSPCQGGTKPVFIMELYAKDGLEPMLEYMSCTKTAKGNLTVKHNSNFAKLYRLTLGDINKARFSKAQQLLGHLIGKRFYVLCEQAITKGGKPYLKVTRIKPENPIYSDNWTNDGTLIKTQKLPRLKQNKSVVLEKKLVIERKVYDNNLEKNEQLNGNDKTLQAPNLLGLEPIIDSITSTPIINKAILPYKDNKPSNVFNYYRHENESLDEYHNRVIEESFINIGFNVNDIAVVN